MQYEGRLKRMDMEKWESEMQYENTDDGIEEEE